MKIFVTGTRGIPDIPGGVETHCQHLYPRIAARGHQVLLCRRSSYVEDGRTELHGVQLKDIFSPRKKSIEAIVHTTLAIIEAKRWGADIVHIHAIGPGLMVPLARLLGLRVVVTHHGPDYDRQKWGKTAKFVLRLGERLGCTHAHEVIVISRVIADIVKRYRETSHLVYNGVDTPPPTQDTDYLDSLGLTSRSYVLAVARFVPEKGLHDLIAAFNATDTDCHLVLAGDADHEDDYSRSLKRLAADSPRVVLTGYVTGAPLHQLFSHARLFVLPSYHEGLPIALLEALSYGVPALVSDIPANLEVNLDQITHFKCGNIDELSSKLNGLLSSPPLTPSASQELRNAVLQKYDWDRIADETILIYNRALGKRDPADR